MTIRETSPCIVSVGLLLAVLGGCGGGALSSAGHDGAVTGADGGDAAIGADGDGGDAATACLEAVRPGAQCDVGAGCPATDWPATCDCEAGYWHCRLSKCDTQTFFRPGLECPYLEPSSGCACAAEFNPNQGNTYCFCTVTDAGTGA